MAESYSVKAILSVEDKGFAKSMSNAANSMNGLDSTATKSSNSIISMASAFAVAEKAVSLVANAIGSSLADAVSRVDTLNQFPQIMEQMGFSSEEAEASINKLSDGIVGLPTSLDSIVSSAQNIALITGNLDEATDVALALNNALIASGASTDEAARATEQYDKMLSTGKVTSQEWTTLEQNMKYALVEVAKELGITSGSTQELYSALQDGSITFDEFNDALVKCSEAQGGFADMAQTASAGIATSWQNVQTAVVRGVANVIQAYNEAASDNSLPTIQEALDSLRGVADVAFNAVSAAVTGLVNNFDILLAAVTPVVAGMAALKVAETASKSFDKLKSSGEKAAQTLTDVANKSTSVKQAQDKQKTATEQLEKAEQKVVDANNKMVEADQKLADAAKKNEEAIKKKNEATKLEEQYGKDSEQAVQAHAEAEQMATEAEEMASEARSMNAEATAELSKAEQESTTASQAYADAQKEEASAQQATTTSAIAKNAALSVLSGQMNVVEAAQKAWNASMAANPIGTVVTAVSALVGVLGALGTALNKAGAFEKTMWKQTKKLCDATDDVCDSVDEVVDAFHDDTDAAKKNTAAIKDQVSEITELSNKQNKSADDIARMQTLTESLNGSVEGLNLAYDAETDSLNMTSAALESLTTAYAKLDEYQASQSNWTELTAKQTEAQEQLTQATDAYNAALEEYQAATAAGTESTLGYSIELAALEQNMNNAAEAEQKASEAVDEAEASMTAAREEAVAAAKQAYAEEQSSLQQMVANDTIAYEDLSEVNQQTVDDMKSSIQDLADTMSDGTQSIVTDLGITRDEYLKTAEENQAAVEEWGNNMEALRDRMEGLGLDTAILDQWAEVPDEGIPMAAMFVDASDEELERLAEVAPNSVETASTSMLQAWGVCEDEIPSAIQEYVTEPTEQALGDQLRNIDWSAPSSETIDQLISEMGSAAEGADFNGLGESMDEGIGEGLTSSDAGAQAGVEDVENIRQEAGAAAGEGSPAAEWIPLGQSMDEGVAQGLIESTAGQEAAVQMAESLLEAATAAITEADFSGAVEPAMMSMAEGVTAGMATVQEAVTVGMETASSEVTTGMASMQSAVTSGMSLVQSAMQTGFTGMSKYATTAMSSIKSAVSSGMSGIASTTSSGMASVRSAVSSGFTSVTSAATSGMSKFKSTVTSGMNSVSSTVTSKMNTIKNTFSTSWTSINTTVTSKMNTIKSTISSSFSSISSTVTSKMNTIKSSITNGFNSAYNSAKSAMSKLASAVSSYGSKAVSSAKSTASRIASAFSGLYSKCYSYGVRAMQGLRNGINSAGSSAVAAARSIANQVSSAMSSALKVGSPSKVTTWIGKMTGIGLANGLKAETGLVTYASNELAEAATPEITTFASLAQPRSYSTESQLTANGLEAVDLLGVLLDIERTLQSDDFMPDVYVQTELDIDGKEFAKTTAPYMQDAEDKLQARQSRRDKFAIG